MRWATGSLLAALALSVGCDQPQRAKPGAAAPAATPSATTHDLAAEKARLQGTWKVESAAMDALPAEALAEMQRNLIRFSGDNYEMFYEANGKEVPLYQTTYKLVPSGLPKGLDLTNKGSSSGAQQEQRPCIYELQGDQLKLCLSNPKTKESSTPGVYTSAGPGDRPGEFTSKGCLNLVLRRVTE